MKLIIGYLYPDLMNIYGDTGNVVCLTKRAEWRGIEVEIRNISIGDKLEKDIDLYFFGGGQDTNQIEVAKDLADKAKELITAIQSGVPLLGVCGGYQLLGEYYRTLDGKKIDGIGLFPAFTKGGEKRMIENLIIESENPLVGQLVGFENHSGQTFLREGAKPLGRVITGSGNNGNDGTEGCRIFNAIGTYMHGSLLPKNPKLADWLIQTALEHKYGNEVILKNLDDSLENQAHKSVIDRFLKV